MTSKFTPGPWLIANNGKQKQASPTFRIWRTDPDQTEGENFKNRGYACIVKHVHREANARLIAAAPELYEAVRLFVAYDSADDDDGVQMMMNYNDAIKAARAALAKADGAL